MCSLQQQHQKYLSSTGKTGCFPWKMPAGRPKGAVSSLGLFRSCTVLLAFCQWRGKRGSFEGEKAKCSVCACAVGSGASGYSCTILWETTTKYEVLRSISYYFLLLLLFTATGDRRTGTWILEKKGKKRASRLESGGDLGINSLARAFLWHFLAI